MSNDLEKILQDKTLSKEQKIEKINQYYDDYRAQIDKELRNYLAKQYAGTALEIGSAALPIGGVSKLGGEIGKQLLKKQLGRKISENLGSGALSGGLSGSLFGLGKSLTNGTNPVLSTLQGSLLGMTTGATLGIVGSNIQKAVKGQQLKNYGNIDNLDEVSRKQYNNDSRKFYQDYVQEVQLNKNGKFDFSKRGVQEQLRWNPQQAQNFPELVNDIKNAKRLPDVPNSKPLEKPDISHYEVYRGKNGDHYIEVSNSGKKRYYITKDTPTGSDHATSTGTSKGIETSLGSPTNSIPPVYQNYNPQTGNNVLYGSIEKNVNSQQSDLKDGSKRYYITKDTRIGTPHATSTGSNTSTETSLGSPTNSIPPVYPNYNPQTGNNVLYGSIEKNVNSQQSDLSGYKNPLTGSNHIYTREEVGQMSSDEYAKHENEIDAQTRAFNGTMPSNSDLQKEAITGGGVVYVNSYTRSDGTEVRGYYRSR